MENCNFPSTPGTGSARGDASTGSVIFLAGVDLYYIRHAVNQLVRAMSKPAKAQVTAAKHLLPYFDGTTDLSTTLEMRDFKLASFSDASWGKNQEKVDQCHFTL